MARPCGLFFFFFYDQCTVVSNPVSLPGFDGMKIDRLIEAGVGRLEKLGFYAGLDTPLEGAEVHDVMDHLLTPPGWGVIPPTVEGEQLATINSVAKRYVASWMAEGADPRIAIQHLTIPNKEELLTEAILYWYGAASLRALAAYYHKHF